MSAVPALDGPPPLDRQWYKRAACAGVDPDLFHPHRGEVAQVQAAKDVCFTCPGRFECLVEAVLRRERHGVWGGTSERERRALVLRVRAGESAVDVAWNAIIVSGGR